jgi:hypothetical protein
MSHPIIGIATETPGEFSAVLDPLTQPFLFDHALNSIPVLPGVISLEGCAAAALASAPEGWQLRSLEQAAFLLPLKFYRDQPVQITWQVDVQPNGDDWLADVTMHSTLERQGRPPLTMQHFSAQVRLCHPRTLWLNPEPVAIPAYSNQGISAGQVYALFFHGPAMRVLSRVERIPGGVMGWLAEHLPTLIEPPCPLLTAPLRLEGILQTAAAWQVAQNRTLALPSAIQSVRYYPGSAQVTPSVALVYPQVDGSFNAHLLSASGELMIEVTGYRTAALPYTAETGLMEAFVCLR